MYKLSNFFTRIEPRSEGMHQEGIIAFVKNDEADVSKLSKPDFKMPELIIGDANIY